MQLTCQVKDADTVFYSIKNELLTAMQLTCQVEDADTVFYTTEEWTVHCSATHLPSWRCRHSVLQLKKRIVYPNTTHLPGWRWRHSVLQYRKMNCLLQCNSPAMLKMEAQCFTLLKNGLFMAMQLTCQVDKGDLTVSSAWIQRLPWLPDMLKMVLVIWPPCRRYTWKLPIVLPYMWYQKRRQAPAVDGCEGLISWAFWPWWRVDASMYM